MEYIVHKHDNPSYSQEILKYAFDSPNAGFMDYRFVNKPPELQGNASLLYLLLQERHHPGLTLDGYGSVKDRILTHIRNLIGPGHEPSLRVGPIWGHACCSTAITLIKFTPTIWNELTDDEKNRLDWIMKAYVINCSWASSDQNDFLTGPELLGNYSKHWNPNIRAPHVIPMIMAVKYFGSADYCNDLLMNFNYDDYMMKFQELNFTNMLRTWAPAGKTLFEKGGACYLISNGESIRPAGSGKGVKFPYVYHNVELKDFQTIFNILLIGNASGGPVVNEIKDGNGNSAHLPDGVSSPVLGLNGMMTEFNSHDAEGIRSDCNYCAANFCILVPCLAAAIDLDIWDPMLESNKEASQRTSISITDFLFKITHGYIGFQHGHPTHSTEKEAHGAYPISKELWFEYLD